MSSEESTAQQLRKIDTDIAHYQEKFQLQQKRIQFLKKQNQELKEKQSKSSQMSNKIKDQNDSFKKRNRELKSQLNELKLLMVCANSDSGPKTATIKDLVVTTATEEIDLPLREVNDDDIEQIKPFKGLKTLILGQNNITNTGFYTICNNLFQLQKLFINHNQISDQGIQCLPKLKHLKCLDIRCNKITSFSLKYIGQLVQLTQLSLSNNEITDQNLQILHRLTQLTYLDITSNKITERGGMVIAKLAKLNNLYLSHNQITAKCVEEYLRLRQLKVLDVRFNSLSNQEREILRANKRNQLQLFL